MFNEDVDAWIENPELHGGAPRLLGWLQGFEAPVTTAYENAYEWILNEHKQFYDFAAARTRLIKYLGQFLRARPDKALALGSSEAKTLLSNTFRLCSELRATELADILQTMAREGHVQGEWNYIDLRRALQTAIVVCQRGAELHDEWFRVLNGNGISAFAADAEEAAAGAICMTESPDTWDKPWMTEMTRALGLAARRIEEQYRGDYATQRDRFDQLRLRMKQAWVFDNDESQWDLLQGIRKSNWPAWAALREHLLAFRRKSPNVVTVLTSKYLAECLPPRFRVGSSRSACPDTTVRELEVNNEGDRFLRKVGDLFEKLRKPNPHPEDGAIDTALLNALQEIHNSIDRFGVSGKDVEEARRAVFAKYNMATAVAYPDSAESLKEGLAQLEGSAEEQGCEIPRETVRNYAAYALDNLGATQPSV